MKIGSFLYAKLTLAKSWLPVQRKARCEMQTWVPIRTGSKFRMKTSSPIQECAPTSNRQGKWIFTRGLITTPSPIFAPKARNKAHFRDEGQGRPLKKNTIFTRYQTASNQVGRPRSKFSDASNKSNRIRVMLISFSSGFERLQKFPRSLSDFKMPTEAIAKTLPNSAFDFPNQKTM